jgi:4-carboxymuconolactone decarboxylase
MRLAQPRVQPVDLNNLTAEQKELLAPIIARGPVLNIFKTLVNKPKAAKRFMVWANYVISERNDLPPREREIVILRIGFLCKSGYEWGQHVEMSKRAGLKVDEIERVKQGAGANGWTEAETLLLKAADELHHDQFVSDATWTALRKHFTEKQCMDVVFTGAQYTLVSMILNSFGVQLDPGLPLDPDLKKGF